MDNIGIIFAFHPFFWTFDIGWQYNWKAYCFDLGPISIRICLYDDRWRKIDTRVYSIKEKKNG